MQEKVEILINGNGPISVELLSEFEINDAGNVKKYILLTNNDIDQNGLIKILASEIDGGQIKKIESEEDWTKVKNIMRSIISSSPETISYINTSENKSFNADENYARVIAVQDSAKQAILQDYFAKRPEVEKIIDVSSAPIEDPNASIYPTENTVAPIGSEIANGISETPEISDIPIISNEEPVEDDDEPIDINEPAEETSSEVDSSEDIEPTEETSDDEDTTSDNAVIPTNVADLIKAVSSDDFEEPTDDEEPVDDEESTDDSEPITKYNDIKASAITSDTVDSYLDRYKEELVREITEAVDKYVENIKLNIENQELKSIIGKLEDKLNS